MRVAIVQSCYIPWKGFFDLIGRADLYVVQGATKEHLIPAVKDIIEKVDFASGKMIINPPEGLLDL